MKSDKARVKQCLMDELNKTVLQLQHQVYEKDAINDRTYQL